MVRKEVPVVGYRRWSYCNAAAEGMLAAHLAGGYRYPMLKKGQNEVECPADHRSPHPGCRSPHCGISAYIAPPPCSVPPGLDEEEVHLRAFHGVVLGWGRVLTETKPRYVVPLVKGAGIWRAQYVKLVALAVDPETERLAPTLFTPAPSDGRWAHRLAARYGVPLLEQAGQLEPLVAELELAPTP
jgi:hypothetical protein